MTECTPRKPADRLRIVAKNLEKFWGPSAVRGEGLDEHTLKIAGEDARSLIEVAELLEALS